jgi:hypothetical protein
MLEIMSPTNAKNTVSNPPLTVCNSSVLGLNTLCKEVEKVWDFRSLEISG